jgi:N-methylhydantoinase A
VQAVTWRLSASAVTNIVEPSIELEPAPGPPEPIGHRPMVFGRGVAAIESPVYRRADLGAGATFEGPAVVEERETTSVIRPGWSVEVAVDGSLIATRRQPVRDQPARDEESS